MDFSNIFPSSDNLYKYLFAGGLIMILFGIVYSFEQKQRLLFESNLFNKQSAVLMEEISQIKLDLSDLRKSINNTELRSKDSTLSQAVISDLKKETSLNIARLKETNNELKIKSILLDFEGERIIISDKLYQEVKNYKNVLIIFGSIILIYGYIGWRRYTNISDQKNKVELDLLKKKLNEN
jgi:hypothetical protein